MSSFPLNSNRSHSANNKSHKKNSLGTTILSAENIEFELDAALAAKSPYLKTIRSRLSDKEV